MKKGIHPEWHKNAKIIFNGKQVMTAGSTKPELNLEIWSGNHPFYTGQQILVDTDNLVEKFNKKREAAQNLSSKVVSKKEKRAKRRTTASIANKPVTLKDMLKDLQ